uniref:Putative ribonuclease H-like domain-containing protein n=1 Tax=Tanacetum cinerariifolium TaxID=118510 RepID=A0A699HFJ1_TANCI|nr:putative ribonuclease H-like domain-containing protein [Tanacetum cinerariifolium]
MIRNKARLVAQGHTQEEGIDYDEVFAPVVRIKAIRLFLAYASFKDFVVYQIDVKSAFLYGKIEEDVYVRLPLGFEDPDFPDRVYKVKKALYGLYQAPRAWYETLSTYLLDNGFQRGNIDKTLFIERQKGDILLVQVYVDDIIFGSTKKELCTSFEKLMHDKFQMSSIREFTFFLGLQVKQKQDGIFISHDKYVAKIQKKYGFSEVKTTNTPMETQKPLLKDEDREKLDCKEQTMVVNSTTEAEYVDVSSCYGQGRIDEIDADEDIALVSTHDDVSTQDNIFQDVGIEGVSKEEVVEVVTTAKMIIDAVVDAAHVTTAIVDIPVSAAKTIVTTAESTKTNVEVTQDPKRKGVMIQEPEETTTTKTASSQQPQGQDKGKGKAKLIEVLEMPKKRKHQIRADKELAEQLQVKIDEENRIAREKLNKLKRTKLVEESTKKDKAETSQESSSKRTGDDQEQERSKK